MKAMIWLRSLVVELGKHGFVSSGIRYWIMNVDFDNQVVEREK